MKVCTKCGESKVLLDFPPVKDNKDGKSGSCRSCNSAYQKAYRKENSKAIQQGSRKYWLKSNYGLSVEEFNSMLQAQGYRCKICQTTEPGGRNGIFNVDHCHETNKVRGLLCWDCNSALGKFKDNPAFLRSAVQYLEES